MSVLATPSSFKYTPAWRAMIWRSHAFKIHSPLSGWHPIPRDGEWYQRGYPDSIFDSRLPSGRAESWRRGVWTGGLHEAKARIEHLWWWWRG